ncbi:MULTISPECIES: site-2 protease family protein [Paenibacillus]|uniref:site-2 protease family protein n=1 Tax=Paenibacillus TaxID=44249 RepID=UPI0004F78581|nr:MULTISPECIES: site-2 protease family protein [Paenibacillus]AIQ73914.1 Zn-dependent protease [Paenibacillus odorifer]MEC0130638.1 site-2 protease family protein [Paenibacillus odorifer]MEC0220848.1 site-2 protease family protein [Paenibacillus odorifer]OMC94722.1 site-2 protease family protein [Paenibacillus odorifer]OMC99866.1 site-2 protease family protein [Paenibacillus odorifer]
MQNEQKKNTSTPLKWLGGGAAMLLLKGKAILSLLKIGKIAGPLISMMVSIGAYALIYPWGFAIGIVLLLLVHELGHVIAAKRIGLPVSAPLFIPFLGALITMKKHPLDAKTEAYVAFGGPILGTIGSTAVFGAAYYMDSPLLYSLAYIGFLLNLINLLPIHPLDGGRIATAVTRWLWLVGLVGGLAIIVYLRSILFFIIWAMFAYDLYNKFVKRRNNNRPQSVTKGFLIPVEPLREAGYMIPGAEHRRDLPFTTYSDLERQQYVVVRWDQLNYYGKATLPQQCIIEKVRISQLEQVTLENGLHLKMHCDISYTVHDNDKYYDVPASTRWKYGTAYFVLAGFLVGMMYLVHLVGNVNL